MTAIPQNDPVRVAAAEYRARGFGIRRVPQGQKGQHEPGWSLISQEPEDFYPGCNVAIMTGKISSHPTKGDLVCVDLDSQEAIDLADDFLPPTGMVEGRKSKPGSHRYYYVKNVPLACVSTAAGGMGGPAKRSYRRASDKKTIIDVLGTGCQVIAPPSLHESGELRRWEADGEPAEIEYVELIQFVEELALQAGWERPKPVVRQSPIGPVTATDEQKIKRAKAWLAKVPPAVAKCGGHDRTFRAACALVLGFNLTTDQAFALLQEWNAACVPPWSDAELMHKIESANKKPDSRGYLLVDRPGGFSPNGDGQHWDSEDSDRWPEEDCQAGAETESIPEPPVDSEAEAAAWERVEEQAASTLKPIEAVDDPHKNARAYRDKHCRTEDGLTFRVHREENFEYAGTCYRTKPEKEHRAALTEFTKQEMDEANLKAQLMPRDEKKPPPVAHKVPTRLVGDIANALAGMTMVPSRISQPAWLDCDPPHPAEEMLATRSSLIHIPSFVAGKPYELRHTPRFFSTNALDYDFNIKAPTPVVWLDFLNRLWPDDPATIETLQDWFGYLLLPDTRQQKILMLLGPKRGGKGTLMRVLRGVVGMHNAAGPTLAGLGTNFGLWPLLGKTVGIINDARLSGRTDISIVVERLLSISGEDAITIDRKFLPPVTTKLPTRFVIVTNELPRLGDSSGALTGRVILLRLTNSWFGKEDVHLTDRLLGELPSILLWAIEGWRRMKDRGFFIQPDDGKELLGELEDLSSPVGAFVKECCELGVGCQVSIDNIFTRWQEWCTQNGRKEPGLRQVFGRDLQAAIPSVRTVQIRDDYSKRHRVYEGIRLHY